MNVSTVAQILQYTTKLEWILLDELIWIELLIELIEVSKQQHIIFVDI